MLFWAHWLSDLALQHDAVVVSPNYRLMPECTAPQIYEDIEDFWTWLHSSALTDLLAKHTTPTEVDLSRILVCGDSAGGLLSVSLGLSHPEGLRGSIATYPMLDVMSEDYWAERTKPTAMGPLPRSVFDDTMKSVAIGTAHSSETSPARLQFMVAAVEHGTWGPLYGRGLDGASAQQREAWIPMEKLESASFKTPQGGIAIIHGKQDSVVPVGGVEKFVSRAREVLEGGGRGGEVTLTVRDGDHGFDGDARLTEPWIQDAIRGPVDAWLR